MERSLYGLVEDNRESYITRLRMGIRVPMQSLEEAEQAGMDFILEMLEQEEYLLYGIDQGFIVTGTSGTDRTYSVIEENLLQLEQMIFADIREDEEFDLLLYRMLIEQGAITGEQICRVLLEQGAVQDTGHDYESLGNGTVSPYGFARRLGLEPEQ